MTGALSQFPRQRQQQQKSSTATTAFGVDPEDWPADFGPAFGVVPRLWLAPNGFQSDEAFVVRFPPAVHGATSRLGGGAVICA